MRFRRKSGTETEGGDALEGSSGAPEVDADGELTGAGSEIAGPFDASEVDLEERDCIDIGSLLVTPVGDVEMRLQVDEESGQVIAAVLVGDNGALELRAFASSRGGGAWDELRPRIAEETVKLGGSSTEQEGSFGHELMCLVPVQTPEGEQATQANRVIGCEGPNWLLRATLMGQPAVEPETAGLWEATIRQTVVRRGREAMAPGAPLPLTLPPQAHKVD